MFTTMTDIYNHYCDLFGSSTPVWTQGELLDWENRLGKRYEEITPEDVDGAYDESLDDAANLICSLDGDAAEAERVLRS